MRTAAELTAAEQRRATGAPSTEMLMRLRYGLNIGGSWQDLTFGPARAEVIARIREAGTSLVRVFVGLDHLGLSHEHQVEGWRNRAALIEALLQTGAAPMI